MLSAIQLSKDVEIDQNIDHCLDQNGCIIDLGLNQVRVLDKVGDLESNR